MNMYILCEPEQQFTLCPLLNDYVKYEKMLKSHTFLNSYTRIYITEL